MPNESTASGDRVWTDDQLRDAIETSRSWRGVLRSLGFKPSSTHPLRKIKKRVAELELDTGHFTGRRRWADKDLCTAVAGSSDWAELITALGYADGSVSCRSTIKAHAARLGLDLSHLSAWRPAGSAPETPEVDLRRLRDAATSIAMAWFILRGQPPSLPIEPQKYDLAVETVRGFKRVQVKSTTRFSNNGWQVSVSHRPDKNRKREPYSPDDVDLFFIIDGDMNLYLVPIAAVGGRIAVSLRSYENFRVGNARSMLDPSPN